ncbi:MFS transporter [Kribbella capetownensis]|uniref:MFS transporter n=1 Tax=Kribbella capetownensis TaxID=1572659 RepID=A0A4R0JFX6_9ACTN|nr:MFS transporter [Kribbella capetownensis]TCC45751.1 MFS transporter [Kribbella capetownensis]
MDTPRRRLIALCAVQFVDVMGVTVVVSALPRMIADLGGSPAQAGLLVPVYAVGFSSLLLLAARLGDQYGHRRGLIAGLVLFAAGSVVAAAAPAMTFLVTGRALQGVAAAISVPNALVLLARTAGSGADRDRALGIWNATGGLAGAAGLLIGGLTTSAMSWRAIFWGNLVLTAILVAALLGLVQRDEPPTRTSPRIDLRSVVLQVTAVAAIVAAANTSAKTWPIPTALGLTTIVTTVLLIRRERRTTQPLVPADLWRPGLVAGLLGSFGVTATTSSLVVIATIYLQDTGGFSPAEAGLMILPFSGAVAIGAGTAGRLMSRRRPRQLLVGGLLLILAGAAVATIWSSTGSLATGLVLAGLGNGAGAVAAYGLGTAVPPDQQGSAAGLLNTAAQIGTATMVAATVAIATVTAQDRRLDYRSGWLTVVGTALVILLAVVGITRTGGEKATAASGDSGCGGRIPRR